MLMINNIKFTTPTNNIQNKQKQSSLRSNAMAQNGVDTVSFKAREESFLKNLRELCSKKMFNNFIAESVEGLAHDVDPKHPDVIAEFEKIKKDNTISKCVKTWVLEDLPKEIGIGGNKILK